MVTILPEEKNTWGGIGEKFGAGLVQGYTNRADETAIQNAITALGPTASGRQILDALTKTKTYNPESKQTFLKNFLGAEKIDAMRAEAQTAKQLAQAKSDIAASKEKRENNKVTEERAAVKGIVNQLDLPEENKTALGESLTLKGAEDLFKQQMKPKKGAELTPFEKAVQQKNADEYISLSKEIPKIESTLGDIDYARQLSEELGIGGSILGAAGLSGKAKELEGVSFTLMEPIVKIFNPSGPIAQQKLKMIQDKYVIKPTDPPWTRKAKLDSLQRFAKQALSRANQKLDLIKQYGGNPPDQVIKQFDQESDTVSDAMLDYDLIGEEATDKELPSPKDFTGKTITSPEGKKYFSDGTRWVKK